MTDPVEARKQQDLAHASAAFGDALRLALDTLEPEQFDAWLELTATALGRVFADRIEEDWNRE